MTFDRDLDLKFTQLSYGFYSITMVNILPKFNENRFRGKADMERSRNTRLTL